MIHDANQCLPHHIRVILSVPTTTVSATHSGQDTNSLTTLLITMIRVALERTAWLCHEVFRETTCLNFFTPPPNQKKKKSTWHLRVGTPRPKLPLPPLVTQPLNRLPHPSILLERLLCVPCQQVGGVSGASARFVPCQQVGGVSGASARYVPCQQVGGLSGASGRWSLECSDPHTLHVSINPSCPWCAELCPHHSCPLPHAGIARTSQGCFLSP